MLLRCLLLSLLVVNEARVQEFGDWTSGHDFRSGSLGISNRKVTVLPTSRRSIRPSGSRMRSTGSTEQEQVEIKPLPLESTLKPPQSFAGIPKLDWAVSLTYFCNAVAVNLPIILMPMIAAEQGTLSNDPLFVASAFVASAASIATLGGGVGKVLNGFVCQAIGARTSASFYLIVMSVLHVAMAVNTSGKMVGWILAGLEFCASIQWTAGMVMLSNHYRKDPVAFTEGVTRLSLSSTAGVMLAKLGGIVLLQNVSSWRNVQIVAAGISLLGAFLVRALATEYPEADLQVTEQVQSDFSLSDVFASLKNVLSSNLFWMVGLAHSTAFLARSCDRVLGSFFLDATHLPGELCGGLTASVTFGFAYGLRNSARFNQLRGDTRGQVKMLRGHYLKAFLSCAALAVVSNQQISSLFPNGQILAAVIFFLTGYMSSNLSFQFYQLPAMAANAFGKNRAVCLSFMDGLGFFLSAPAWAATAQLVTVMGDYGWTATWTMLAILFGVGSSLMLRQLPTLIDESASTASVKN